MAIQPRGSLAFVKNGTIEFRDPTGTVLQTSALATSNLQYGSATLDGGIFAADDLIAAVKVFTRQLTAVGTVAFAGSGGSGLAQGSLAASQLAFYAGRVNFNGSKYISTVKRVSDAAVDVQTWTLPDGGIGNFPADTLLNSSICVSWDGQILYYSVRNRDNETTHTLRRYDLVNSTPLSDFAADPSLNPIDAVGLSDGTIVSVWTDVTTTSEIRVYSAAGTLLNTFPIAVDIHGTRSTRGIDDTSVWIWVGLAVSEIRIADGAVLHTFSVTNYPNDGIALFVVRGPELRSFSRWLLATGTI